MDDLRELDFESKIGERVFWCEISGKRFEGELVEWDSNVAIVKLDSGKEKAVECS